MNNLAIPYSFNSKIEISTFILFDRNNNNSSNSRGMEGAFYYEKGKKRP